MKTRFVSKLALTLEALALAYPTWMGILMAFGAIAPFASGSLTAEHFEDAATGILMISGLLCGWFLAITFLLRGRVSARQTSRWWWIVAMLVALAALIVYALYEASRISTVHGFGGFAPVGSTFGVLGYGVMFVPSYIHLSAEVWLRAPE